MDIDQSEDPGVPRVRAPLCRHLRSKGMFVTGEQLGDPHALPYDATIWWCLLTQKPVGPDDGPVHGDDCRPGRSCCTEPDAS